MKQSRYLLYIFLFILVAALGCTRNSKVTNEQSNQQEKTDHGDKIQTGDLLFVELPVDYDLIDTNYVATSDEMNLIHVAILENSNDTIYVIDATFAYGVDRHPIDTFYAQYTLRDGSLPKLEVRRLKDNAMAEKYVENAKQYLGAAYDVDFAPDNDMYYCSELVGLAYLDAEGNPMFPLCETDMTSSDGSIPRYWTQLCDMAGIDLPHGMTVFPRDIYKSDFLVEVDANLLP